MPQLTLIPTEYEQLRDTKMEHWRLGRQRHLVPAVLILTDFLLSLLIWTGSSKLQSLWGNGALSQMTTFAMVAVISSWIGLRALLGRYPGYGLDPVEQLRRHTYAVYLPARMRWRLSKAFDDLKTRNLVEPPPLQPEVHRQLIRVYREDILKVQELIHRDLSGWLE